MTIDWKKLWEDFDEWIRKMEEKSKCSECGKGAWDNLDWSDQQKKIQSLVKKAIRTKSWKNGDKS